MKRPAWKPVREEFCGRVISPGLFLSLFFSPVIVGGRSVRGQWWLSCIAGFVSIVAEIDISLSHDIIARLCDEEKRRGRERRRMKERGRGRKRKSEKKED